MGAGFVTDASVNRTNYLTLHETRTPSRGQLLTPAEQEVVALLASGWRYRQIARNTNRSLGTVKLHASIAMRKTGVYNQTQLVLWWHGLLAEGVL